MQQIDVNSLFKSITAAQKAANNDGHAREVKISDHIKKEGVEK